MALPFRFTRITMSVLMRPPVSPPIIRPDQPADVTAAVPLKTMARRPIRREMIGLPALLRGGK
jgi:hypothetical protein